MSGDNQEEAARKADAEARQFFNSMAGGGALATGMDAPESTLLGAIQDKTAATLGALANGVEHFSPGMGQAIRHAGIGALNIEHSVGAYIGSFNVARATDVLRNNATTYSRHICAKNVREACQAGGIDLTGHPIAAKDYEAWMADPRRGFTAVGEGNGMNTRGVGAPNYVAQDGDICVETAPGHESGHICMFDAKTGKWISDFVQRDMQGGPSFRLASAHHTIYRHQGAMVLADAGNKPTTAPARPVIDHAPAT